jgi:alginate O-acetyltransferase complex protein AlgI
MAFNSFSFLVFFVATASLTFVLPTRVQRWWLLAVGYLYYATWVPSHIVYLIGASAVAWCAGMALDSSIEERRRGNVVALALILLLGQLAVLKYARFAFDSVEHAAAFVGVVVNLRAIEFEMPLGVSFFTFQAVGYVLDVYWRRTPAEARVDALGLYVSFFPQLVSGPIARANALIPQFESRLRFDWGNLAGGSQLFLRGVFKKVVLADTVALYVSAIYNQPERHGGISIAVATFLFAFQIYGDLSGYTDMARGCARVLGIDLMENFQQPFFATSVTETWRRWHISLSSWIGDYLHRPLAMRFRDYGNVGTVAAIMISFVVVGLWHGASWSFVLYGVLQGVALSVEALSKRARKRVARRIPEWLVRGGGFCYAFGFFCVGLVVFRSSSVGVALECLRKIAVEPGGLFFDVSLYPAVLHIAVMVGLDVWDSQARGRGVAFSALPTAVRWTAYVVSVMYILQFSVEQGAQFIYFQF